MKILRQLVLAALLVALPFTAKADGTLGMWGPYLSFASGGLVSGQDITPGNVTASGIFTGDGSGLFNLNLAQVSSTNPATSSTILVGGISGTLVAGSTNTASMTTIYAVNNLIIGNSASVPSLSGKLLIRQTSDGAGLAMRIYNQSQSQFTGVGMDTSSVPCWYRGASCIVNLMSTGISVAVVSATTGNFGGTVSASQVSATTASLTTIQFAQNNTGSAPFTCAAGTKNSMQLASNSLPNFCNGSSWVKSDGTAAVW